MPFIGPGDLTGFMSHMNWNRRAFSDNPYGLPDTLLLHVQRKRTQILTDSSKQVCYTEGAQCHFKQQEMLQQALV